MGEEEGESTEAENLLESSGKGSTRGYYVAIGLGAVIVIIIVIVVAVIVAYRCRKSGSKKGKFCESQKDTPLACIAVGTGSYLYSLAPLCVCVVMCIKGACRVHDVNSCSKY